MINFLTDKLSAINTRSFLISSLLLLFFCTALPVSTIAQTNTSSVSGKVTTGKKSEEEPLGGAHVHLFAMPDSSLTRGTATDIEGKFTMENVASGEYLIRVTYLGFQTEAQTLTVEDRNVEQFNFRLKSTSIMMDEFKITARRLGVEARGDTTLFHADSYRSVHDATTEDMVRRMPGLSLENGRLQSYGEDVKRIMIDGEEYFGQDAILFLRNLPPDVIKQVEVYDRPGEQAQFTGFNDGRTERTLNIVTKKSLNKGHFGRVNSGYGTQTRYVTGGNYNYFNGSRKITLIGMTNNANQNTFSDSDFLDISENSNGNVITGSGSGINSVHFTGFSYNDRWNDSWRINSSYFFNTGNNERNQSLQREYLNGFSANQIYSEDAYNTSDNFTHRFNTRLEHTIDDNRSLIIKPSVSFRQNSNVGSREGLTLDEGVKLLNGFNGESNFVNDRYNISGSALYRQRYEKKGRSFSANLKTTHTDFSGDQSQYNESFYYDSDEIESSIINDQRRETFTGRRAFSANVSYTEPVSKNSQLLLSYQPSIDSNNSIQEAFQFDVDKKTYSKIDSTFSNKYNKQLITQQAQSSYRFGKEPYSADVSLTLQHTDLSGEQVFPDVVETSRSWKNLLPSASFRYRLNNDTTLRFLYNTSSSNPSVWQLQDVIDNSNPLRLTSGNPDLSPEYNHRFSLQFRSADTKKGTSTTALVSMGFTQNPIGNQTIVAQRDTLLEKGTVLGRGSRLILPKNFDNSWNLRARFYQSMPFDLIQSNLSLNSGIIFNRSPSVIDEERILYDNVRITAEASANRYISEQLDYNFSYEANYHIIGNPTHEALIHRIYTGKANNSISFNPWKGLLLASDLNLEHQSGLGGKTDESTIYWNGAVGYKFMEKRAAEVRLTLFDILAQNNDNIVNRSIAEDYIAETWSNQLSRYFIMTFSYNFRSFAG